jgi:PKD repeat protein
MKTPISTQKIKHALLALFVLTAGVLTSTKANASCKAGLIDTVKGKSVYFYNNSSAVNSSYKLKWTFGDGTTSDTKTSIGHTYASYNTSYKVCVYLWDSVANCRDTFCTMVTTGKAPCTPSFNYASNGGGKVIFSNTSFTGSGSYTSSWDFGDGSAASTDKSPTHIYSTAGSYKVCLTIKDSASSCSSSNCVTINVCTIISSFTYTRSGYKVSFTSNSTTSSHTKYSWYFGDGTKDSTSGSSVTHTYSTGTSVNADLLIYDSTTKCSVYSFQTISLCALNTTFTYSTSLGKVTFTGPSNGTSVKYSWDFGDKSTSTLINPVHTYAYPGQYNICLTVTDTSTGCNNKYCVYVSVNPCTLSATYTYSVSGRTVSFTGNTNAGPHSLLNWNFGDGTKDSTSGKTVSHTYSGTSNSFLVYFYVVDSPTKCYSYYYTTVALCKTSSHFAYNETNLTVQFTSDTTNSSHTSYHWVFGDGATSLDKNPKHVYSSAGNYSVCLTAYDSVNKCDTKTCQTLNIVNCTLTANFYDSVVNRKVSFYGTTNISHHYNVRWFFGDGTTDSTSGFNPVHTYSGTTTSYVVYIRVYDSISKCIAYANKTVSLPSCSVTASFSFSNTGRKVSFTGKTNASAHRSVLWIFADGTYDSTSGLSATHTYAGSATSYHVYLRVYDSATKCAAYSDHVISLCHVSAHFAYAVSGKAIKVVPDSTNASTVKYYWAFGDGTYSHDRSPAHTYSAAGYHFVCLYASDSPCTASYCDSIYISSSTTTYCLHGTVYTGTKSAYPCKVYLITFNATDSSLSAVDSVEIKDTTGKYEFCGLKNGTYYTKAALTKKNSYYKYYVPTYHYDALKWASAKSITIYNANDSGEDIKMKTGTNSGGAGFIGGKIKAGANKTGDPVSGVQVMLYDLNYNPVFYTYSDVYGEYAFAGIAFGTYYVEGEIPGKVPYPVMVTVSDTDATKNNIDLSLNSSSITGIIYLSENWSIENTKVYPNPVKERLTIATNLTLSQPAHIQVYDITGKSVVDLNQVITGGPQSTNLDVSSLHSGLYFLKIELSRENKVLKAQFVKVQ